uniref:Uncharacterized protein n=1 Tax=Candidatus Kentrum sp. TUN TaxID=2126343 RepID=A0A451A5I6_9GAMM|nr:MAG: hypothetical protein BECKTUN1418D_GA0071000_10935 [Candidatus Kentron sp. TUN]VFK61251.1 MAG: hypothetical protein BECKTUN1418E_GA0071001_106314 [Candidatus Kentron sp. TUN]
MRWPCGKGTILQRRGRSLGQKIQGQYLLFQDRGENQGGDLVVLHQVLEHDIVDGIGYLHDLLHLGCAGKGNLFDDYSCSGKRELITLPLQAHVSLEEAPP